jgi:hypothetical protein
VINYSILRFAQRRASCAVRTLDIVSFGSRLRRHRAGRAPYASMRFGSHKDAPRARCEPWTSCPSERIFFPDTPQSSISKGRHQEPIAVDKDFYTRLTDQLLDQFYPRFCCKERLTQVDGKRELMLRCPYCHKQQSRLTGPLRKLRVPRWYFSYLLTESVRQYPKVLTIVEIKRRLGLTSMGTAYLLKRRLQLFASEVLPRMQEASTGITNFDSGTSTYLKTGTLT